MVELSLNGLIIEVHRSDSEDWRRDIVYIYDPLRSMKENEDDNIIDYLYSEGFIIDRRTHCQIF